MHINPNDHAAIDLLHVLVRSTQYIRKEVHASLNAVEMPFQLSAPRLRVLSTIRETGVVRMNELAEKLKISARTLTDFVNALEKDQLLIRVPDPSDRRATLLQLTELAEHNLDEALAIQAETAEALISELSAEERKQLLELLLRLINNKDITSADDDC